jgi:hypothetical protein
MDFTIEATPKPAHRYRLPALLQDIRLLDLLEISGTTLEAARAASLSQPTVSRRTRSLARDFGLKPHQSKQLGCCYSTSTTLQLLRLGCRAHRLSAGVARLGADVLLQPLLAGCHWLLPAPPRFRSVDGWLALVRQGVLDGALVSGLEFPAEGPPQARELELLWLGALPLALATGSGFGRCSGPREPAVLVPNQAAAQGLKRGLAERGLTLKAAGNTCQSPAQWLDRLARFPVAMALATVEPADWWRPLQMQPLAQPLHLPLWLVLPEGWRKQTVLAHTAEQMQAHPALCAGEGA